MQRIKVSKVISKLFTMSKQTIVVLTSPHANIEDAQKLISDVTGGSTMTWHIDNKYYETDVDFHVYNNDDDVGKLGVEAVILLTNSKEDSLTNLATQMELVDKWSPQVRLLICEKCSEDDDKEHLNRGSVLHWCLENEMELIEMKPDSEDCEPSDYGVDRIVSALQSHTWPNLMLKTSNKATKKSKESAGVSNPAPKTTTTKPSEDVKEADEEDDDERFNQDFQTLMSQMHSLKAECLSKGSKEDQVKYAEKITKAFWEVLGGEDGEFDSD